MGINKKELLIFALILLAVLGAVKMAAKLAFFVWLHVVAPLIWIMVSLAIAAVVYAAVKGFRGSRATKG